MIYAFQTLLKCTMSSEDLSSPTNSTQDPPYFPTESEMEDEIDSSAGANFSFDTSPLVLQASAETDTFVQGGELEEVLEEGAGSDAGRAPAVEVTEREEHDSELTEEELKAMKEIHEDGMDEDISEYLKNTENKNTRASTEAIVTKYNRVMSLVAKKTKTDFVPLDETPRN